MMHDKMLVTYVINLKRSTERMENMDRALKAMQVDYERVEGVDAQLLSEVLLSRNATPSVEYPYELAKGELACFYSHRKCWEMLVNSQHEWALVLEDHCEFSEAAGRYLRSADWLPSECELVQLIYSDKACFADEKKPLDDGNSLVKLACSSAIGSSAYLISRGAAVEALRMSARISEPADNFLFGPWSEFSRKVPCWRLLGGVVRRRHGIKTTIAGRNVRRKFYLTKRLSLKRLARKMQMALQKRHLQETVQYWLE